MANYFLFLQVIVANRPYQLYVQSYLQYGANAIKVKVAHEISARLPEQKEIDDPCMLKGECISEEYQRDQTEERESSGTFHV